MDLVFAGQYTFLLEKSENARMQWKRRYGTHHRKMDQIIIKISPSL
jgi:hypothetical protein